MSGIPSIPASAVAWPAGVALRDETDMRQLDWPRIAAYLAGHGLVLDPHMPPRQFVGGLANFNFLVRVNDTWMVLRRPPDGPLPPGANDMAREHRILSRLWEELPFASRSHHLCEDPEIAGAPFLLVEFRSGLVLHGGSLGPLEPTVETGQGLSRMLVDTLAAIHAVDPERIGLGGLGRPEGFFRRTAQGWIRRAELASGGELCRAAQEAAGWLQRCADPADSAPVLLHNDFKLNNIILDPQTLRPNAVVDWDMGTRGDALFDLTTLLSYWSEPGDPDCMLRLEQMPSLNPGFASRESVAAAYARATGRSLADIKPYRVLTTFKLGVVFQQLHSRYVSGETSDPRYVGFGQLGLELHEFTLDVINDRIF
ncbi:phosphotransferase family protein [Pseudomonas jinjuensis]|uniref:Predicted kinase, aminoglycoside phosphotransferase (APT) family n=1 Tax=Pseudomonas jinjuensis TaxID=198616 RepID=A0A1G9YRV7_9PSED|nr:phosphotransferase family protein [Pseudomonas jinjuensis]SDN11126.1 Predicted kinase, aminoglycoside phosphotransferase (APT) family [Pseudomonas jinjuensis]